MTPPTARERAEAAIEKWEKFDGDELALDLELREVVTTAILSAQRDAIERCARFADSWECSICFPEPCSHIGEKLRALPDEETP